MDRDTGKSETVNRGNRIVRRFVLYVHMFINATISEVLCKQSFLYSTLLGTISPKESLYEIVFTYISQIRPCNTHMYQF